jgi:putative acetyltransferase
MRAARPDEEDEIEALLVAAFGQPDEAALVRRLRADGDMWVELVKPWNGVIAGYAALSRMQAPAGWACLAPVAVLPRFQRGAAAPDEAQRRHYAIGTRLAGEIAMIAYSSESLRASGKDVPTTVVVLGEPRFYERAGFSAARAQKLVSPYSIEHTLIARPGDDVPVAQLIYPTAFSSLA